MTNLRDPESEKKLGEIVVYEKDSYKYSLNGIGDANVDGYTLGEAFGADVGSGRGSSNEISGGEVSVNIERCPLGEALGAYFDRVVVDVGTLAICVDVVIVEVEAVRSSDLRPELRVVRSDGGSSTSML